MIIEQMTLLVLILSRWLLPKGDLTREELSQLLLVIRKKTDKVLIKYKKKLNLFLGLYWYSCGYN
jgi:hypothetical protein